MRIEFKRLFKKQFKKLSPKLHDVFEARLRLLVTDPTNPSLRVHALKGNRKPLKSMNINGDYRALFIKTKISITFYEIGTHDELYDK